jgi:4-hydroxy-4-methyl-2-oxoglutarate aldolase
LLKPEILEKLRSFDTPTICNIIELFDVRPRNAGYMDDRIKACFPEMPPVVGFASTAAVRSAAPSRDAYGGLEAQLERFGELSGPPIVVFQDLDEPHVAATFGEVMCSTYQAFGAVGLISSGAGRDLDQVRAINFPIFTDGTICSHGYFHIPLIHVPVHVGGVVIQPDDLLHADVNGVTTIPVDIAAEVADIGDEFVAAERIQLQVVQGKSPTLQEFAAARKESQATIASLSARVSRKKA